MKDQATVPIPTEGPGATGKATAEGREVKGRAGLSMRLTC